MNLSEYNRAIKAYKKAQECATSEIKLDYLKRAINQRAVRVWKLDILV